MTPQSAREAAALLWTHWREGRRLPALPDAIRPVTREDGYAIQAALAEVSGRTQFGWKIAATSSAGQAHIGVDGPLAGRLLNGQIDQSGDQVALGTTQMRVGEPEFAFRMGGDLPPRAQPYTVDEVMAAVGALHTAIEVPDSRYDDFVKVGGAQIIADNACAHRFVLGPATTCDWRAIKLSEHPVHAEVVGKFKREGVGRNVLGGPDIALTWLANELSALGIGLRMGQVITTGTCMQPVEITPGDHLRVDYGPIGRVEAVFTA